MSKEKIGIATVCTGYNFGSALQSYATKNILARLGYDAELLVLRGTLFHGRDIRIKKLIVIALRSIFCVKSFSFVKGYFTSIKKKLSPKSIFLFDKFLENDLNPRIISYGELKTKARTSEYVAFLCGSDQIWNSASLYVDPFYYLRFSPPDKRIAFAPSFGRDYIPEYNYRKISKYVSEIKEKSVREDSGVAIIQRMTGQSAISLLDPTLVLSSSAWDELLSLTNILADEYLFAYFLDEPSELTIKQIVGLSRKYNLQIIGTPYQFNSIPWKSSVNSIGPREFVEHIKNAKFVCTDSFHGTAFALNYNIPFLVFERNYGDADNQSERIISLLNRVDLMDRYVNSEPIEEKSLSFEFVNKVLETERKKCLNYLVNALSSIS